MEIVDEILTPGCPNCAIKHLSAALAGLPAAMKFAQQQIDGYNIDYKERFSDILRARARINFVEAVEGYESHWDYGVGLLVHAEERAIIEGHSADSISAWRNIRCRAMTAVDIDSRRAVISDMIMPFDKGDVEAHIEEAYRELPELRDRMTFEATDDGLYTTSVNHYITLAKIIIRLIKWVRDEFFTSPSDNFENKPNEEKGEATMATAKKAPAKAAAKKAPAKAAAKKAPAKKACKK